MLSSMTRSILTRLRCRRWPVRAVLAAALHLSHRSSAQGILIRPGAEMVVDGNASIVINDGSFTSNGHFMAGAGTVVFTGSGLAANPTIGGSSVSFNHLSVNRSGYGLQMNSNISVIGNLNMLHDSLFLNGYDLTLGSAASIVGESDSSHITGLTGGYVVVSPVLNAPSALNPNNIGVGITSAVNMGLTTIRRGEQQQTVAGNTAILRYYDITPANDAGLNATLRFYYLDAELAGAQKSQLSQYLSNDGGTTWSLLGLTRSDTVHDWVETTNIDNFGRVTLAGATNPLPITLLYFQGQTANDQNVLQWETGVEINNDYFDVERAPDGTNFIPLGTVQSLGNTNTGHQYTWTDKYPLTGANYYRLTQVDMDGHSTYSGIIVLHIEGSGNFALQLFPNPTHGLVTIRLNSPVERDYTLSLYNQLGQLTGVKTVHCSAGMNQLTWDLSTYAAGEYTLHFNNSSGGGNAKIIKW
jgi:hypothetical protein